MSRQRPRDGRDQRLRHGHRQAGHPLRACTTRCPAASTATTRSRAAPDATASRPTASCSSCRRDKAVQQFFLAGRYPDAKELDGVYAALRSEPPEPTGWTLPALQAEAARAAYARCRWRWPCCGNGASCGSARTVASSCCARRSADRLARHARQLPRKREQDQAALEGMVFYAQTGLCRWQVLLAHLEGEAPARALHAPATTAGASPSIPRRASRPSPPTRRQTSAAWHPVSCRRPRCVSGDMASARSWRRTRSQSTSSSPTAASAPFIRILCDWFARCRAPVIEHPPPYSKFDEGRADFFVPYFIRLSKNRGLSLSWRLGGEGRQVGSRRRKGQAGRRPRPKAIPALDDFWIPLMNARVPVPPASPVDDLAGLIETLHASAPERDRRAGAGGRP